MDNRMRCQICVIFIIAVASFRFRQMIYGNYLSQGSYFQHFDFLLNAFLGFCWFRSDLIDYTIKLILGQMFVLISTIYLSATDLERLHYWGTYRTKYLLEAEGNWPEAKIVQAETFMEAMLGIIVIKALEEIRNYMIGMEAEVAAKKKRK